VTTKKCFYDVATRIVVKVSSTHETLIIVVSNDERYVTEFSSLNLISMLRSFFSLSSVCPWQAFSAE
jgi:hypothetical protein